MKLFSLISLSLAVLTAASPVPEAAPVQDIEVRAATPEEVNSVFGFSKFEDFLNSRKTKRADSPSLLFARSTVSICQRNSVWLTDASNAIAQLEALSPSTNCGNNLNPPACAIMRTQGSARLGFCGPRSTSIPCSLAAKYLRGIAKTCSYSVPIFVPPEQTLWQTYTGGYQGLNENNNNYVFIDHS